MIDCRIVSDMVVVALWSHTVERYVTKLLTRQLRSEPKSIPGRPSLAEDHGKVLGQTQQRLWR